MTETDGDKINADIAKLMAETMKLSNGTRWFEAVIVTAIVIVGIAIAKVFL